MPLLQEEHDTRRELRLIHKERELLEREQQLLRREREITRNASATNSIVSANDVVRSLRELLSEFDATNNRWRHQLKLLRNSYQLDDNSIKILISSRLKG